MNRTWLLAICMWALGGCATAPNITATPSDQDTARLVLVTLRNQPAPAALRAGSTVRTYEVPSSYSLAPATRGDAKALAATHGLREVSAWPIGLLGVHCIVFELPAAAERDQVLEQLRRDHRVESAQPLHSFRTLGTATNDPYRNLQHNLDLMNVSGAHLWSRGEGVRVAVIDTGVDDKHPDLTGRIVRQENFVDDAARPSADRHGTAVAGVIAAIENNEQGIIGIAPAARLYSLRACWPQPEDAASALCSTLTLAKAIAAAIELRMEVVNLSLTGPADPLLTRLVETGLRRGIVFVGATPAAAQGETFPTGIAGVISVGVSGSRGSADSMLFAPGDEVLTLVPDGRYDFLSGSSLAAASVSGGIALLLARDRSLHSESARAILARSSRLVSTTHGEAATVNLCAALASLMQQHGCVEELTQPH